MEKYRHYLDLETDDLMGIRDSLWNHLNMQLQKFKEYINGLCTPKDIGMASITIKIEFEKYNNATLLVQEKYNYIKTILQQRQEKNELKVKSYVQEIPMGRL